MFLNFSFCAYCLVCCVQLSFTTFRSTHNPNTTAQIHPLRSLHSGPWVGSFTTCCPKAILPLCCPCLQPPAQLPTQTWKYLCIACCHLHSLVMILHQKQNPKENMSMSTQGQDGVWGVHGQTLPTYFSSVFP